jgi:hypothetical protein
MAVAERKQDEPAPTRAAYDEDFYGWALEQGALLRAGRLDKVDLENVAEEIEALGRGEFSAFVSFLRLVMAHMLKCEHQLGRLTRSWSLSIALHRDHARTSLEENPSFRPRLEEALDRAYRQARLQAARETKLLLSKFPERRPYTLDDVFERPFPIGD